MSLSEFVDDPWRRSHSAYDGSPFSIKPAPEFATAEVVVASLYRAVGFAGYAEAKVPSAGREFDKASRQKKGGQRLAGRVTSETWATVLHGVLESPKQPNQSSKRFLQLCPVVPDVAIYSGSARLAGNSWNPGTLVHRIVEHGSPSADAANQLWGRLFEALSVGRSDDLWARWLQEEFEARKRSGPSWGQSKPEEGATFPPDEKPLLRYPAQQFVSDLDAILDSKESMTRRQWMSLLEAVLRLGAVSHVLWLCNVNDRLWRNTRAILNGECPPSVDEARERVVTHTDAYLAYGNQAVPTIRDFASRYLLARLGINLLLWHLESLGAPTNVISSCADMSALLKKVHDKRSQLLSGGLLETFSQLQDRQSRTIACKKNIGANLVDFGRHVLGQRQTANENLRGYDQGYILRKKGDHASAPWVVSMGPVAVLAFVHACLRGSSTPQSIQKLCQHLGSYGIEVDRDDIAESDLGRKLRMLGLVLDSPDAESGMLLLPPFRAAAVAGGLEA